MEDHTAFHSGHVNLAFIKSIYRFVVVFNLLQLYLKSCLNPPSLCTSNSRFRWSVSVGGLLMILHGFAWQKHLSFISTSQLSNFSSYHIFKLTVNCLHSQKVVNLYILISSLLESRTNISRLDR